MKAFKGRRSTSKSEHESGALAPLDSAQHNAEVVGSGIVDALGLVPQFQSELLSLPLWQRYWPPE